MISNVSLEMAVNEDLIQMVHCISHTVETMIDPEY